MPTCEMCRQSKSNTCCCCCGGGGGGGGRCQPNVVEGLLSVRKFGHFAANVAIQRRTMTKPMTKTSGSRTRPNSGNIVIRHKDEDGAIFLPEPTTTTAITCQNLTQMLPTTHWHFNMVVTTFSVLDSVFALTDVCSSRSSCSSSSCCCLLWLFCRSPQFTNEARYSEGNARTFM